MAREKSSTGKNARVGAFSVDTSPSKAMVVDSLIRDISTEAAIFDLIDNSIDAARNIVFARGGADQTDALPDSYGGFEVALSFSGDGCSVKDNCGGISVESLQTMALRFGQRSSHPMGIGIFGLGLNRALFKLGKVARIKTDTGSQRAELVLNVDDYFKTEDWNILAEEFKSSGNNGTVIEITNPSDEIAKVFGDNDWVERHRVEIGRRYARFIDKGLQIRVNEVIVSSNEVRIRNNGPFPEEYKFYRKDGVTIHIKVGQHSDHRFSAEPDYDKSRNDPLTSQFGWTVICNDRAIVVSDRTWKTGWEQKFHTEFYGFVGVVSFDAQDPAKLPWDTAKFDVDMNHPAYQTALIDMRAFAAKWRTYAGSAKRMKKKGEPLLPLPDGSSTQKQKPSTGIKPANKPQTTKLKESPTIKPDRIQFNTILPEETDESYCAVGSKILHLVHEAKQLNLNSHTYSGMALIRCLFEVSVITHLERHGRLADLKKATLDKREKKGLQIKDEKKVVPDTEEMIAFLQNTPDIWGPIKDKHIGHCLQRMSHHKPTMNGAVHNPWQAINQMQAFAIRDEVLPILRHLIET